MLHANILPPEEKERIKLLEWIWIAVLWGGALVVIALFLGILFLPTYFTLFLQEKEIIRNLEITKQSAGMKQITDIQRAISALNKNTEDIQQKYQNTSTPSSLVLYTLGAIPPGVVLSLAEYSLPHNTINLEGRANTRSGLLLLQENLKKDPRILDAEVPLSNLVSESDILFTIVITLKP